MRFLRENSLSIFFGMLFLAALGGQSAAGQRAFNAEQLEHGEEPVSWTRYLFTSDFGQAVLENWQSEFLQFTTFIFATVWLLQKGSNESKELDQAGRESDQKQRVKGYAPENAPAWAKVEGFRLWLYSNSLLLATTALFLASWLVQSFTGWTTFNDEQAAHGNATVGWTTYIVNPRFWEETLQNWQSEFLAVGVMVVFTIYLRQRGSAESKPVGAPHDETAASG